MTRQPLIARRVEELLGTQVISAASVAGGDTTSATRCRLSDGRMVLVKSRTGSPDDFFASEAAGLDWLARAASVSVGQVLAVDHECLVLTWIETARPGLESAADFGRDLAALHNAGSEQFGAPIDGWIGRLPLPNRSAPSWPEFYAVRRILPYLKLAHDRGQVTDEHVRIIESIIGKLPDLLPDEAPARLHGDLWNGNCLWGFDGKVHLIDPAAHGGHRELDLAMLALFGLPHLARVTAAYEEVTPLIPGWEDRLGLHQLFPLLTHAAMFGGSYGERAARIASRYL